MLIESIKMSWSNIISNKLRSFLTMLGIVIGVASIIALITLVQGATASISSQVTSLGVNKVTISAQGTPLKRGLTTKDAADISKVSNVSSISPSVSVKSGVVYNRMVLSDISILGRNEVYFKNSTDIIKTGRPINILDVESRNHTAIIGSNIQQGLFYGENPLAKEIKINGIAYTVIGVLTPSTGFSAGSTNDAVIIPYTTALAALGTRNITSLDVFLKDPNQADAAVTNIKAVLDAAFNYKNNAYTIFNMGEMISTFKSMMSMMSMLLGGIAAISLVVGGIGIMNMMLVSITERTSEIGLRKALGATPGRIQLQFIIEAIFLSFIGGIIGLIFGALIAYTAAVIIGIRFSISIATILLAIGFSAGVGIIFGYMPAEKASRLNPIDALRSL